MVVAIIHIELHYHCRVDLTILLEATKSVFQCALLETLQKYCSTGSLLLTFC